MRVWQLGCGFGWHSVRRMIAWGVCGMVVMSSLSLAYCHVPLSATGVGGRRGLHGVRGGMFAVHERIGV